MLNQPTHGHSLKILGSATWWRVGNGGVKTRDQQVHTHTHTHKDGSSWTTEGKENPKEKYINQEKGGGGGGEK